MKKIIVTGGSGLIGGRLIPELKKEGYYVINFTRDAQKAARETPEADEHVEWDIYKEGGWMKSIDGAYGIIHLAGASIAGKSWTDDYKKAIYDSRIYSTRALVKAIEKAEIKPEVFISTSAVGYYGDSGDRLITEDSPPGSGFLAEVCVDWEKEAMAASGMTRVAIGRVGVVLAKEGGALEKLLPAFKMFVGGPLGSGEQFWPWIHIDDICGMFLFTLESDISGPVNFVSPQPLKVRDFASTLGKVMGRPSIFPVPKFVLKTILGESVAMVTQSQNATPKAALAAGYKFKYGNLESALINLLK